MKRLTLMVGLACISGALSPLSVGAQERVKEFPRLPAPRIAVPDGTRAPISSRQLCPETNDINDTCRTYRAYATHFVRNSTIPTRDLELIILRTAWLSRGDYIWGRHNIIGREAGLTEEEISRVTTGPTAAGWSEFESALLRAADELHTSRFVFDATWDALAERYTESQLREVVLIVGNYTQFAMFQNTLGSQLEDGVEGLPDEVR